MKKTEVDNNFKDAQKQIRQAKEQIQLAENNGLNMSREKARLEKQQKKLNEQEQEIKQLGSISYYVNDRKNDSGYDTYQSNSEKIELAKKNYFFAASFSAFLALLFHGSYLSRYFQLTESAL